MKRCSMSAVTKLGVIMCVWVMTCTAGPTYPVGFPEYGLTSNEDGDSDIEMDRLSYILMQSLQEPWDEDDGPVFFMNELPPADMKEFQRIPFKRNRIFSRNPWKRQNLKLKANRPLDSMICQPTREEIFRLLVALHESKSGNARPVNICNRRRYPNTLYTHIRIADRKK